jgi:hypothetical protein
MWLLSNGDVDIYVDVYCVYILYGMQGQAH